MKTLLATLLVVSFSAVATDWNELYGTFDGISDNYVNPYAEFKYTDELADAESNGYFTELEEAVSVRNEQNGYWE